MNEWLSCILLYPIFRLRDSGVCTHLFPIRFCRTRIRGCRLLRFLLMLYHSSTAARIHLQSRLHLWFWAPTAAVVVAKEPSSDSDTSTSDDQNDDDDDDKKWMMTHEENAPVIRDAWRAVQECAVGQEVRVALAGESLEDATLCGKVRSLDVDAGKFW